MPPRRELSEEEIASFRRSAVAAAETRFAEDGIAGVTMRSVARLLGCSPMTPYRYFEDREALVAALRAAVFGRLADDQEQVAAAHPHDSAVRLEALRAAYIAFGRRDPRGYELMFAILPPERTYPDLDRESRRAFLQLRATVLEAVTKGEIAGIPGDDGDVAAQLVWVELHGLVSLHLADKLNFGRSLEELADASPWKVREPR